jgi:hypothetical protein
MLNAAILAVVVATGALLLFPRFASNRLWRANITPLASIIGSGFLVLGPILEVSFGWAAPLVMLFLVVLAYLFGSAIRYNINAVAISPERSPLVERIEAASSAVLAFAYIISVGYYLNLFGAFSVSLTAVDDAVHARLVTSAVFVTILFVGWFYGFAALERMEQFSVGLKLAIIAGLLFALTVYFGDRARQGALLVNPASVTGWTAIPLIFGLIVTVQGFETSRYLGETYDPATRIRSMRFAQFLSSIIYMVYVVLLAYVFVPDTMVLDETSIIDLMKIVAPILPAVLVAAALSAQFSAAVADTSGSGGLVAELSGNRISPRVSYALLVAMGLLLTWSLNIFEIISYASRAFALYYALQSLIAALSAWRSADRMRAALYGPLALLGLAITVLGKPFE